MEQPPKQPDATTEIPQGARVVVIARDERSVRNTVAFLNRRGVPSQVVTNLNDAIEMFSKKQANMALLSVNYPHPKIEMIPSLLSQSFDVDCIIFAEDTDRKTTQKLQNTKARHVLFGPVSGPVVLMRVRQIERENTESTAAANSSASSEASGEQASAEESGSIKVGGGKGNQGDRISVKSKKKAADDPDAVAALKTLVDEDDEQTYDPGAELERSGDMIVQKGTRASMKSATQSGPLDKSSRGELASRAFGRAIDKGLKESSSSRKPKLFIPPPPWTDPAKQAAIEAREEEELALEAEAAEAEELASTEENQKDRESKNFERAKQAAEEREAEARRREETKQRRAREREEEKARNAEAREKTKREAKSSDSQTAEAPRDADTPTATQSASASPQAAVQQPEPEAKSKRATAGPTPSARTSAPVRIEPVKLREPVSRQEELFLRSLKEALGTVCGEPIGVKVGVPKVRAAALVSVRSKKVEGAFVIEVGRSRLNPQDYLQRIEVAFFSILRRAGVELQQGEQFAIELEDLEIVEKAVKASDYMLISSSPDHEVAAAVVPVTQPFPTIEPHENKMLKVQLRDLPIDVPVTFDVFLHLPTNQKYLRYLKTGAKMSGKQSTKLVHYSVSHMFLNESDRDAYRKHYAAQSIDPSKKGDKSV